MPTKSPQQDAARPDQGSDYEIVCGMVMGVLVGGDDGVGEAIHAMRDVRLITAPIEGEREVVGLCLLSTSYGPETAKVNEGNLVSPMQAEVRLNELNEVDLGQLLVGRHLAHRDLTIQGVLGVS